MQRRPYGFVLVLLTSLAGLAWIGGLHGPESARADPRSDVVLAGALEDGLVLWRRGENGLHATTYEIGRADPTVGRGWRLAGETPPPDDAAEGRFVFVAPAVGDTRAAAGARVVPLPGVRWSDDRTRLLTRGASGALLEWEMEDGAVTGVTIHQLVRVPPTFEVLERERKDGGTEERILMGLPPRTVVTSETVPLAPAGWMRGDVPDAGSPAGDR